MRIVDKLKKNKIVRSVWNEYKKINTFILLKKSTIHLKKNHKSNSSVFFICQCEYIWNKSRPLYLELKNQGIDCKLFVIPDKININKEKTIFESEFPQDVIKYSKNLLKKYKPGLVIYSRPYDILLPKDIQSKNVVKYTRTAFIPYYYSLEYDYKLLLGKKFLYNINFIVIKVLKLRILFTNIY